MSAELATRTFRATGGDTVEARTIFSGSGILLSVIVARTGTTDSLVNFKDEDDTILFSINAPHDSSKSWSLEGGIVLDNGLVITVVGAGQSNTIVSAFWRPQ